MLLGEYVDRSCVIRGRYLLLPMVLAGAVTIMSCTASAPPIVAVPITPLPVSVHMSSLSLRADTRELTPRSVNLVVRLFTTATLKNISVTVKSGDPRLHIAPSRCFFRTLSPPTTVVRHPHRSRSPYPLPAVPLCSVVLRARDGGQYPLTLRVRDVAGSDLIVPIHTLVLIQGGSL